MPNGTSSERRSFQKGPDEYKAEADSYTQTPGAVPQRRIG